MYVYVYVYALCSYISMSFIGIIILYIVTLAVTIRHVQDDFNEARSLVCL